MILIQKYEDYKKKLHDGENVSSWNTYLGLFFIKETERQPFIVLSLYDETFDLLYYDVSAGSPVLANAYCGNKHSLKNLISYNPNKNKKWLEVFCFDSSKKVYHYDEKTWAKVHIFDDEDMDYNTFLNKISQVIEKWDLHKKIDEVIEQKDNSPSFIFVTGPMSCCPPVAYECQEFLKAYSEIEVRVSPLDKKRKDDLQLKYWIDKKYENKLLSIGQGITLASLLNKPLRLTLPYEVKELKKEVLEGIFWKDLVDKRDNPDYYIKDKPYIEFVFSAGSDADGNIWLESKPLHLDKGQFPHRYFLCSAEEKYPPINNDPKTIRETIISLENKANSRIEALIKKINNRSFSDEYLNKLNDNQLKQLLNTIDDVLDFDFVITDTNVWCTSDGWDREVTPDNLNTNDPKIKPHPVLKYRDLLWTYAHMQHSKGNYLDLEGHCYAELDRHSKNAKNILLQEAANEAKRDIDLLYKNNIIGIPNIPPELTPEERENNGDISKKNDTYADPRIRTYMQRLYQFQHKVMVITRDIALRDRLKSQYQGDMERLGIRQLKKFKVPYIINADDCLLIFKMRARVLSLLYNRLNIPVPQHSLWWKKGSQEGLLKTVTIYNYTPNPKSTDISNSSNNSSANELYIQGLLKYEQCKEIVKMPLSQLQKKRNEIHEVFSKFNFIVTDADLWLDYNDQKNMLFNGSYNIMPTLRILKEKGTKGIITAEDYLRIFKAKTACSDNARDNIKSMKNEDCLLVKSIDNLPKIIFANPTNGCQVLFFCKKKDIYNQLQAYLDSNNWKEKGPNSLFPCIQEMNPRDYISMSKLMNQFSNITKEILKKSKSN